nr:hypothetical protein [uncultured Blautia sp.]
MERNITNLKIGQEQHILVLVQAVEKGIANNGSLYEKLKVRDTEGNEATLYNWDQPFTASLPVVINAKVETKLVKETNNYRIMTYQTDDSVPKMEFLPKPAIDVKEYWSQLNAFAKKLPEHLHKLVGLVLMENQKRFISLPLTTSRFFARQCGIVEATVKLTKMADVAATVLGLDWNLTVTAAILYYVGYTDCVSDAFVATPEEVLIGAGVSAYTKVFTKAEQLKQELTEESYTVFCSDITCINHILLSRYKGISTAIPEAMLLRHLDAIVTDSDLMLAGTAFAQPGSTTSILGLGKLYRK